MSDLVQSWSSSLRRQLAWSNSRRSWQERSAAAVLLAIAFAWWFGSARMSLAQRTAGWSVLLLLLAIVLRRGWLKLFGPVLFYDLVRLARRSRYILIRTAYAGFLLLLLTWMYLTVADFSRSQPVNSGRMAEFAEAFFATFLSIQFAVAALLTPVYTAGAIASEKEQKTLEFLLATDLDNREIVLSKLASRLAHLTFLLLAGLPILSFLQFLGGIDPDWVLAGFTATALTMLSLASFSILNSVLLRRARDAIFLSYLGAVAYLVLSAASWLLLVPVWNLGNFPSTDSWQCPVTVKDLIEWVNAGNIFSAVGQLTATANGARPFDNLPVVLHGYVVFHGVVALVCTSWSVLRLRTIALKEAGGQGTAGKRVRQRPKMGRQPVVWKELYVEAGPRLGWFGRIIVALLFLASFLPAAIILWNAWETTFIRAGGSSWRVIGQEMNAWVRIVGTLVACLLLLSVAVRASGTISGERERQTFDSLLTSPLDSDDLLWGKWVGCVLSVRWPGLWLGFILALGLLTGGLHPLALPLFLTAWLIYAGFLATLGLWFSAVCRSTLRATIATLLTAAGLAFGHWLIWMCCGALMAMGPSGGNHGFIEHLLMFQAFSLTPPITLGALAFHGSEFESIRSELVEMVLWSLFGMAGWAVAALVLWSVTSTRLRELTGRLDGLRTNPTDHAPTEPSGASCVTAMEPPLHGLLDAVDSELAAEPPDHELPGSRGAD